MILIENNFLFKMINEQDTWNSRKKNVSSPWINGRWSNSLFQISPVSGQYKIVSK